MLKIPLPLVIEKPFTCMLWFEFFSVLEKLRSCCLIETSQSSKYCSAKDISKTLSICTITQTVKVSSGICDRMWLTRKLTINIQIFAVSKVSGGSGCNRNANSGTETDVATLVFIC